MASHCDICCGKITAKLRRSIKCDNEDCKTTICIQCFKRHLIMEDSEQNCMACKQPISTEFIFFHTPKKFRDEYVKKVVSLDMVKERALLKATQERMDARTRLATLTSLLNKVEFFDLEKCDPDTRKLFYEQTAEKKRLMDFLEKSDEDINNNSTSFFCPLTTCTGLIDNGRCSVCKKNICSKCREERSEGHECNKEKLETINLLKCDTKPCPGCKVPIHKIDGCDQMFCTKCKTAFSWRTLNIEKGMIHNPHYFEYMTQFNRDVVDVQEREYPCGEELYQALKEMRKSEAYRKVVERDANTRAIINFMHKALIDIPTFMLFLTEEVQHDDETMSRKKRSLRESYLTQRKNGTLKRAEANWNTQLCLIYKRHEIKKALANIIEVFEIGLKDIIIMGHIKQDYDAMLDNINNLVSYFMVQLTENGRRYNLKNKTIISIEHGLQIDYHGLLIDY